MLKLEDEISAIFLWLGVWGTISLFLDHYIKGFGEKLAIYIVLVIVSFTFLHARNHIPHS